LGALVAGNINETVYKEFSSAPEWMNKWMNIFNKCQTKIAVEEPEEPLNGFQFLQWFCFTCSTEKTGVF